MLFGHVIIYNESPFVICHSYDLYWPSLESVFWSRVEGSKSRARVPSRGYQFPVVFLFIQVTNIYKITLRKNK